MKKMSIAVPTALSALLLLACQEPATSPTGVRVSDQLGVRANGASQGNPRATGGGTTEELGEKSTFVFNAVQHKDGTVNGHLIYKLRGADVSIHMDIDCLNIIGNQATMSGTVTKVTGDAPAFIFEGQRAVFKAQDNGEGGDAAPDLISDLFLFTGATCNNPFPVPYLPIDGNIQVSG